MNLPIAVGSLIFASGVVFCALRSGIFGHNQPIYLCDKKGKVFYTNIYNSNYIIYSCISYEEHSPDNIISHNQLHVRPRYVIHQNIDGLFSRYYDDK